MNWVDAAIAGVSLGGVYALLAFGLLLVRRVLATVNLAHGEIAVLGALLTWTISDMAGLAPLLNFVLVIPVLGAIGYALHLGVIERAIRDGADETPLLVFVVAMLLVRGFSTGAYGGSARPLDGGFLDSRIIDSSDLPSLTWLGVLAVASALAGLFGLRWFLGRSPIGRRLLMTADDSVAAQLTGIRPASAGAFAVGLAMVLAAFGGVMYAMAGTLQPTDGPLLLVFGFEALVIGGLTTRRGVIVGAVVLGVTQALAAEVTPLWGELAGHLLFFAVLALRPNGLTRLRVAA